jgi:hypothetical protein
MMHSDKRTLADKLSMLGLILLVAGVLAGIVGGIFFGAPVGFAGLAIFLCGMGLNAPWIARDSWTQGRRFEAAFLGGSCVLFGLLGIVTGLSNGNLVEGHRAERAKAAHRKAALESLPKDAPKPNELYGQADLLEDKDGNALPETVMRIGIPWQHQDGRNIKPARSRSASRTAASWWSPSRHLPRWRSSNDARSFQPFGPRLAK